MDLRGSMGTELGVGAAEGGTWGLGIQREVSMHPGAPGTVHGVGLGEASRLAQQELAAEVAPALGWRELDGVRTSRA